MHEVQKLVDIDHKWSASERQEDYKEAETDRRSIMKEVRLKTWSWSWSAPWSEGEKKEKS